jgi:hypothetical protein
MSMVREEVVVVVSERLEFGTVTVWTKPMGSAQSMELAVSLRRHARARGTAAIGA